MKRYPVTVTTASDGSATAFSPRIAGKIHSIRYVKPGSNPYTDGVDFTITDESTGENIWTQSDVNATASVYPRAPTHSQAGVAALYASAGTAVEDKIGVVGRVKIVIGSGGDTKNGTFQILVDG
jgi:hypothetical protein